MLQWQKFCNGAFENILEENTSMLVFQRALLSDSGTYRCVVSNVINGITHLIESRNATLQGNSYDGLYQRIKLNTNI